MLGVLIVIAIVAAFEAVHQFNALVGDNTKDELSRYLDDNAHTNVRPGGAGFEIAFPVPPSNKTEAFSTGVGTVTARSRLVLVDDEITFEAAWFQWSGTPANASQFLGALTNLQLLQLGGTAIGNSGTLKVGTALARTFAFVTVDHAGVKRYFDERIVLSGAHVWVLRVGSQVRRAAAFARFVSTFQLTG